MVGLAIAGMAVGKYYSQTKLNTLRRMRETPQVELLNEDYQALVGKDTGPFSFSFKIVSLLCR